MVVMMKTTPYRMWEQVLSRISALRCTPSSLLLLSCNISRWIRFMQLSWNRGRSRYRARDQREGGLVDYACGDQPIALRGTELCTVNRFLRNGRSNHSADFIFFTMR